MTVGQIQVKWNLKDFEVKSRSIERQLEPLVAHVTTLVNSEKSTKKGRGKSKKAIVLVTAVERAIKNFIEKGAEIANENPEISKEMLAVVEEIRSAGDVMSTASRKFADDPCVSQKRTEMVKAARNLLTAVIKLLILADMVDVQFLLQTIRSVENSLERLKNPSNGDQLMDELKNYLENSRNLLNQAGRRQQEITDPQIRDDLAAARAVLKKSSTMLLSASKAYLTHPDVPAAKANRDQILRQICEAVETINEAAQGKSPKNSSGKLEGVGKLATNLDNLEKLKALDYKEARNKPLLEQQLEELVNGAMLITDNTVKDERRNKIVEGCNAVREALQSLLNQSLQRPDDVNRARDNMTRKTKELRRQLRKVIADKISDSFSTSPLQALIAAAEKGDIQEVETCAAMFTEHCNKLIEVANQVCELSNNEDGVKMVKYAAGQLATLAPEVVNAARILAAYPQSSVAKENMEAFKKEWESQLQILLDAVDDITTIDDVLSVLDNQMYDDMNQYVAALRERNPLLVGQVAENIKGRTKRICGVVSAEMDDYEPCVYTRNVLQAIKLLNDDLEKFNKKTTEIIQIITENPEKEMDENEFIDATRLIYDGVREVRRAVLMNRADEDLDPEEVELEETYNVDTLTRTTITTTITTTAPTEESEDMGGITVVRQAMSNLPEKEKTKIMEQVENFQTEKLSFDREVAKWDDSGNDIIVLAKYMCIIMIQMTDFVRQRGPLKSTTDVINAAKKISEAGTKLDKLTRQIAEQCPESSTKKDLLAYLERVALYCHQINIISKVKADVQNSNEELILAGVESATSLIENAKNLMNAVVLTVKASYVASTKYSRQAPIVSQIVVWKMKAPEKKPLVRMEKPKEVRAVVRKASQRKPQNPLKILSEFQSI